MSMEIEMAIELIDDVASSDIEACEASIREGDKAAALEPRDALRHRGGGDVLLARKLADGDARAVLDRDEQADLLRRARQESAV